MSATNPNVIEINGGGGGDMSTKWNWLKIVGILVGAYILLGLLSGATAKPQWLGNLNDVLDKSTGMASYLLSHWYLLPIGYLVLATLPSGAKWLAERVSDTVKDAQSKGASPEVTKAAVEKVASVALDKMKQDSAAAQEAAAKGEAIASTDLAALGKEDPKAEEQANEIADAHTGEGR